LEKGADLPELLNMTSIEMLSSKNPATRKVIGNEEKKA
jgi:hypothetical protein